MSQHIGQNVRYLRETLSLTRERLAEYIGSSASQIGALESGRTASPGFFVIERLARLSGVSSDEFVRGELCRIGRDRRARRVFELDFTEAERLPVIRLIEGTVRDLAGAGRFRASGGHPAPGEADGPAIGR